MYKLVKQVHKPISADSKSHDVTLKLKDLVNLGGSVMNFPVVNAVSFATAACA